VRPVKYRFQRDSLSLKAVATRVWATGFYLDARIT
jgi:hypothetical protein